MPKHDGTGPLGSGKKGRGLGPCGKPKTNTETTEKPTKKAGVPKLDGTGPHGLGNAGKGLGPRAKKVK